MADLSPFRAWRYSAAAGPLQDLVTQPYDKITPAMRERYLSLSPYNLVRLILDKPLDADNEADKAKFIERNRSGVATDLDGDHVLLATSAFNLQWTMERNPEIRFTDVKTSK